MIGFCELGFRVRYGIPAPHSVVQASTDQLEAAIKRWRAIAEPDDRDRRLNDWLDDPRLLKDRLKLLVRCKMISLGYFPSTANDRFRDGPDEGTGLRRPKQVLPHLLDSDVHQPHRTASDRRPLRKPDSPTRILCPFFRLKGIR